MLINEIVKENLFVFGGALFTCNSQGLTSGRERERMMIKSKENGGKKKNSRREGGLYMKTLCGIRLLLENLLKYVEGKNT